MDRHLLLIFRTELQYHCELGMAGVRMLDQIHKEAFEGPRPYSDRMWFVLQGILGVAANAAKLLWGSEGPDLEKKREPLREAAGVTDESPLKPRRVRNAFEHFDERIEKAHETPGFNVYASRAIGTDPAWPPSKGRFGHYNPHTGVVTFIDDSVSIADLLAEFRRIHGNLTAN